MPAQVTTASDPDSPITRPDTQAQWLHWIHAILGMDLDTFLKMFFIKSPTKIPGKGSVMMTDWERTQYLEGYKAREQFIVEKEPPPTKTSYKQTAKTASETAQKAETARLAEMSTQEQKTYYQQYDNREVYAQKAVAQREAYVSAKATASPQTTVAKPSTPAPSGSPTPTPTPDNTAFPAPDSTYSAYEARRASGYI